MTLTTTTTPTRVVYIQPKTPADRVAVDLAELADAWLASLRNDLTRRGYLGDMRDFGGWLDEHRIGLFEVSRRDLDRWVALLAAKYRPATIVRKLAGVHSFYDYAESEGLIDSNPVTKVKRPKVHADDQNITRSRTADELNRLITAATAPRDRALIEVLAIMGLRISEACALDLDGLERDRGHLTVIVKGKGGRFTKAAVPPRVAAAIEALAEHEDRITGPVFQRDGRRWSTAQATRAVRRLGRAAGLEDDLRPHQLRASAITLALELGDPLHRVQNFARHASPTTTQRYNANRESLDHSPAYTVAAALVS